MTRTHNHTHAHTVGLLWTNDRPDAEACACKTHNICQRQTSVLLAVFEPVIPASEGPQSHALDHLKFLTHTYEHRWVSILISLHSGSTYWPILRLYLSAYTPVVLISLHSGCTYQTTLRLYLSDYTPVVPIRLHSGCTYQPTLRLYLSDYAPAVIITLHSGCTYQPTNSSTYQPTSVSTYRLKLRFHLSVSQLPVPCQKVSVQQGMARRTHLMLLLYRLNILC